MVFTIFFGFCAFILFNFTKLLPLSKKIDAHQVDLNRSLKLPIVSAPQAEPTPTSPFAALKIEDVGEIESYLDYRKPKKDLSGKNQKSNIGIKVAPTDELIQKYHENDDDLKKTLKEMDLTKPPIQGEVKIQF